MKRIWYFILLLSVGLLASCSLLPNIDTKPKSSSSSDVSLGYSRGSGSRSSSSARDDEDEEDVEVNPEQRQRASRFRDAQLLPVESGTDKSFRSASNGVSKTNGIGEPAESKRTYKLPDNWTYLAAKTKDEEQDMVFQVHGGTVDFLVQLYALDAYTKSPLQGGQVMTEEELKQRMEEDGRDFQLISDIEIDGKKWNVGFESLPDSNLASIVFFRLENTGNFDDTLLVGSFIYPYEASRDFDQSALREVGHLKSILAQLSKDK